MFFPGTPIKLTPPIDTTIELWGNTTTGDIVNIALGDLQNLIAADTVAGLQALIDANAAAITSLQSSVQVNANAAASAQSTANANAASIAGLTSTVSGNTSSISTNTSNIASNTSAIATINSNLIVPALRTVSATSGSLLATDVILHVDDAAAGAQVTISLSAASGYTVGRQYIIKKSGSSFNVIVEADGSETINGSASQTLTSQFDSITIYTDGSNWFIS